MYCHSKSFLTFTNNILQKTVTVFFALDFVIKTKFSFFGRTACSHSCFGFYFKI